MNEALARVEANARTPAELAMAKEMRRIIEGRRRGAQKPRKPSEAVTQRIAATLQAFSELSPKLQKHPRGTLTSNSCSKPCARWAIGPMGTRSRRTSRRFAI